MTVWQKIKSRLHSWAAWAALLSLIALVGKEWFNISIPGWDRVVEALMMVLTAFGIINNPDNRNEF